MSLQQHKEKIRKRKSYKMYQDIANELNKMGVPVGKIPAIIKLIHKSIDKMWAYNSHRNSLLAWQSINTLINDLK